MQTCPVLHACGAVRPPCHKDTGSTARGSLSSPHFARGVSSVGDDLLPIRKWVPRFWVMLNRKWGECLFCEVISHVGHSWLGSNKQGHCTAQVGSESSPAALISDRISSGSRKTILIDMIVGGKRKREN